MKQKKFKPKIVNIFLFINLNVCLGCSREPSHWDGSFEHPQHMFWLSNKKNYFQIHDLIWMPDESIMRKYIYNVREQQRSRSACASAQADLLLCCSLPAQYNHYHNLIHALIYQGCLWVWAGWFESYSVVGSAFWWWVSLESDVFIVIAWDNRLSEKRIYFYKHCSTICQDT